jgi:hypothetical protein
MLSAPKALRRIPEARTLLAYVASIGLRAGLVPIAGRTLAAAATRGTFRVVRQFLGTVMAGHLQNPYASLTTTHM